MQTARLALSHNMNAQLGCSIGAKSQSAPAYENIAQALA